MEEHAVHKDESNKVLAAEEGEVLSVNRYLGRHYVSYGQVDIDDNFRHVDKCNHLACVLVVSKPFRHRPHSYVQAYLECHKEHLRPTLGVF